VPAGAARRLTRIERAALLLGMLALADPVLSASPAPGPPGAFELGRYAPQTRPPEFRGRTVEGQAVSLADLAGRVVLLNFWATWCLECRPEMPEIERLHREFGTRGLTVMAINAREGSAAVRAYAKELGLTFPLVLDPNGDIGKLYGVIGIPTTFLIGRDGRAVALAVGPRAWGSPPARAVLQELLSEPVPRPAGR
jgi:peroxiredoxin